MHRRWLLAVRSMDLSGALLPLLQVTAASSRMHRAWPRLPQVLHFSLLRLLLWYASLIGRPVARQLAARLARWLCSRCCSVRLSLGCCLRLAPRLEAGPEPRLLQLQPLLVLRSAAEGRHNEQYCVRRMGRAWQDLTRSRVAVIHDAQPR
jgi:hypothetical protein